MVLKNSYIVQHRCIILTRNSFINETSTHFPTIQASPIHCSCQLYFPVPPPNKQTHTHTDVMWWKYFLLRTCICVYCHCHALRDSQAQLVATSSQLTGCQAEWGMTMLLKNPWQITAVCGCNLVLCFTWCSMMYVASGVICSVYCGYLFIYFMYLFIHLWILLIIYIKCKIVFEESFCKGA
jgi:hypothetical protein